MTEHDIILVLVLALVLLVLPEKAAALFVRLFRGGNGKG